MPAVVIPRLLRETFGDDVSETLVDFFNQLGEEYRQQTIVFVEEKFERRLTEEFARLRSEDLARLDKRITEEIAQLRQEMAEGNAQLRTEIANVKAELSMQIADSYTRQLRWMFVFWIGQVGVILAILLALLR